jgi:hypothetical protein
MTQVVTVHTDFTDLNQMTQGLVGRVNDSHVILPAKDPVDVGEWVQFAVTLFDGSPAFAGVGRCVTFVDNGEDRLPHQRFDVVFDSLQFDSRGQQIYDHILALSGVEGSSGVEVEHTNGTGGSGHIVDVSADDVASASSYPAPALDDDGDSTLIASDGVLQEALARSAVHSVDAEDFGGVDEELATNPPPAGYEGSTTKAPPNGANHAVSFSYPGGLPFPAKPPRPEIEPSLRVTPAPRPN